MKAGFYNRCFFDLRLCEERRRSERSGMPFSVLSVDILTLADAAKKHARLDALQLKQAVSDIVRANCRISDIKAWYDETTLKILLPETSMQEANVLCDKLNEKLKIGLRRSLGLENNYDLKKNMVIASFPEVIKPTECLSGEKTGPAGKPKAATMLEHAKDETSTKTLTIKWDRANSMSLTWPLYSDIINESNSTKVELCLKRAMDIMGALAGIIFFSPMMLIVALLIKITSCGPILFRQERMGFLGKKFTFLKFRSMYVNCSEERHKEYVINLIRKKVGPDPQKPECKPVYKMNDDPRITPFGHFLRKSSIDELPQLFNVLKGDMSLVGPRPPIPYEVEKYENWHFRRVLEVKPGITGLWQVEGRSSTTFDEMVRLDLAYVNKFSVWLDLKIMFKTIWVVFSGKGAY